MAISTTRLPPALRRHVVLCISQIDYACLDAYAAVLLYAEISKFKDPIFCEAPREVPPPGTEVIITATFHFFCVKHMLPFHQYRSSVSRVEFVGPQLPPSEISWQRMIRRLVFCLYVPWQVRLFTSNHASCVAVGHVQTQEVARTVLEEWGTPLKLQGRTGTRSGGLKRTVVKIVDVLKPASLVMHTGAPPPVGDGQPRVSLNTVRSEGGFVLWDVVHVRLASDHRWFRGTPVPAGGADPEAYQDNFFDAPQPAQAVYRKGEGAISVES